MTDDIGEIMRKLRVRRNYSQEFVAEKVSVDYTTYSRYERGETSPKFEVILALADLYKMTLDEIVNHDNPTFKAEEPKASYTTRWSVPIMVSLDGTEETLQTWLKRLTAINAAL